MRSDKMDIEYLLYSFINQFKLKMQQNVLFA